MFGSFLITLREGLEAALIIGIVLAVLAKTKTGKGSRAIWLGTAAAILASLVVGGIVFLTFGDLHDPAEAIFEGTALFTAVAVLTWMIFWMRKQSVSLKADLQSQIQSALNRGSMLSLALIAFMAVVREGIETVLFLFAANSTSESPVLFILGGLLGLAVAAAIGYAIYKNSSRLNLRKFFTVTGLLLIVFGAGLLAQAVHEFNELGIIPPVIENVWNTNGILSDSSTLGNFLQAIFGYNASPSLTEVMAYLGYLIPALFIYLLSTGTKIKPAKPFKMVTRTSES